MAIYLDTYFHQTTWWLSRISELAPFKAIHFVVYYHHHKAPKAPEYKHFQGVSGADRASYSTIKAIADNRTNQIGDGRGRDATLYSFYPIKPD
jgi:hypothetical protein